MCLSSWASRRRGTEQTFFSHAGNKYFIFLISNVCTIYRHDTYCHRLSLNQKLLRSNSSSGGACSARVVLAPGAPRKARRLTAL